MLVRGMLVAACIGGLTGNVGSVVQVVSLPARQVVVHIVGQNFTDLRECNDLPPEYEPGYPVKRCGPEDDGEIFRCRGYEWECTYVMGDSPQWQWEPIGPQV